jgi:ATP-binding cassette subfamily F protein uup
MALVNLQDIKVSFGGPLLLEGVDLSIDRGERVCLVGRNGTGKSTIMRLIAGEVKPDGGRIVYQQGVRITLLTQEVPHALFGSVFEVVSSAFGEEGKLLAAYHQVSARLAHDHSEQLMAELEDVQHKFESAGGWQMRQRVEEILTRLQIPGDAEFSELSGGLKRRVLLARALAGGPDLLLLDEPTNHLDIDSIAWLEEFLLSFGGTLLFVTHDREEALRLGDRIGVMVEGRIRQLGRPAEVFGHPTSEEVARFVGVETILDGHVIDERDGLLRVEVEGATIEVLEATERMIGRLRITLPPVERAAPRERAER